MRRLPAALIPLLLVQPAAPSGTAPGGAQAAPASRSSDAMVVVPPAVLAALQSVVSVWVLEVENVPIFHGGRFQMEPMDGSGAGSGVVVAEDGLILTNAHVVARSSEVRVRTAAGDDLQARVVSLDEASDLALLRVAAPGGRALRPLPFAEGDPPAPGTAVYALGDRGDAGPQVVWGAIGSHHRVRVGARALEFWSEVEAPVGPGNSGGALVDAGGRLVGVPSLLIRYADAAPARSLVAGLFIPASHAHRVLHRMIEGGVVVWPWIGLLLEDPLMASSEGKSFSDEAGVRVRRVFPGSPAEEAGFRKGDRIVAIGARRTHDNFEALDAALDLVPGRKVTVGVERAGSTLDLVVSVVARPPDPRPDPLDDFTLHTGLRLTPRLDPDQGRPQIASSGLSERARSEMLPFEAELFASGPILGALLPGQDALAGSSKRSPVASTGDLSDLLPRCFVNEQFVALAHWTSDSGRTVDRAHVHRKIYPVVI